MNQGIKHKWYTVTVPASGTFTETGQRLVRHLASKEQAFEVARQELATRLACVRYLEGATNVETTSHESGDYFHGTVTAVLGTEDGILPLKYHFAVRPHALHVELAEGAYHTPWVSASEESSPDINAHILVQGVQ